MPRSRRVVHVDPSEFHPTAVAAWTTANSWAAAVAPRARADSTKKKKKQSAPKEIVTTDEGTVSTGMMSATTQAAIAKMNEAISKFEVNEKKNEDKIAALDKTIANIAENVARISESQEKITKSYVEIQEQFVKMAEANEITQKLLQDLSHRVGMSQSASIITTDTEMESSIAGKRAASAITGSPIRTRSQSRHASRATTSQPGATHPCASFLPAGTSSSISAMSNPSNGNGTQGTESE